VASQRELRISTKEETVDQNRLSAYVEKSEVHRMIIGSYQGSYSLGVAKDPENPDQLIIKVSIVGKDTMDIPQQVVLDGELIPILVDTNWQAPLPLATS
jgi:hypothetical protein